MKIVSFNLNGIRSSMQKGFKEWVSEHSPDFIAVQETKAQIEALDKEQYQLPGYHHAFSCAEKKGYSGVGIYAKHPPEKIHTELGLDWADSEGRYIAFEYPKYIIVWLYMPSGSSGEHRQALKYQMMSFFFDNGFIQSSYSTAQSWTYASMMMWRTGRYRMRSRASAARPEPWTARMRSLVHWERSGRFDMAVQFWMQSSVSSLNWLRQDTSATPVQPVR